jgi:hypothetical protein
MLGKFIARDFIAIAGEMRRYKFDTNERVRVFLARRSMQYLVVIVIDLIKLCWYLIHVTINIRMVIV